MLQVYIRLDHHSVSDPAINTNPLFDIPHFIIDTYPYCPLEISPPPIPLNDLFVFGSSGTLDIPAEIKFPEIRVNDHAAVGKDQ
jgi:hypothetical protein